MKSVRSFWAKILLCSSLLASGLASAAPTEITSKICPDGTLTSSLATCKPVLSDDVPGGSVLTTTANYEVDSDTGSGDVYGCAHQTTTRTAAEIVAGTGCDATDNTSAVDGKNTLNFTGLTQGQLYEVNLTQVDGARTSNVTVSSLQMLASGGSGLEAEDNYYFASDGDNSNTCLTDAQACLTASRADTLPQNTGAGFYVEAGYTVPGTLNKTNSGDGAGDTAPVSTYCNDGGSIIAYDSGNPACSAGVGAFENIVYASDVTDSPAYDVNFGTVSGPIKIWAPGPYLLAKTSDTQVSDQAGRLAWYATDLTNLEGACTYVTLADLVGNEGDYGNLSDTSYGIGYINAELDGLPAGKKMCFIINDQSDDLTQSWGLTYPVWFGSGYGCRVETSDGGARNIWAVWDGTCRDKYKDIVNGVFSQFKDDPRFHILVPNKETSYGTISGSGFTNAGLVAGLNDIISWCAGNFPSQTCTIRLNQRSGNITEAQLTAMAQNAEDNGAGFGGPDLAPWCAGDSCESAEAFIAATPDDLVKQQTTWFYDQIYGCGDFCGDVPSVWSVETSELGNGSVGEPKGYDDPQFIHDYGMDHVGATHILWARRTSGNCQSDQGYQMVWGASEVAGCSVESGYGSPIRIDTFAEAEAFDSNRLACPTNFNNNCWTAGSAIEVVADTVDPHLYANAEGTVGNVSITDWHSDPGPGQIRAHIQGGGVTALQRTTEEAYRGNQSYKAVLTDVDAHYRSELRFTEVNRGTVNWEGHHVFWGAAMKFDTTWPVGDGTVDDSTIVGQFHCDEDNANCTSPPIAMRVRAHNGEICVWREYTIAVNTCTDVGVNVNDIKGGWSTFIWEILFSETTDGIVRLWIDDSLVYEDTGAYSMQPNSGNFGFYKGCGLYASWHRDRDTEEEKILYCDEMRVVDVDDDNGTYADVNPANF
tara:strand:- start:15329 stop:18115 length:2787 start_codon:yes stop_codon:yes gene_type:complete